MLTSVISRNVARSVAPRACMAAVGARHMSSLGNTLEKKGKVEEDRYMRTRDAAALKRIHDQMVAQAQAAALASEETQFANHIQPVMMEVKALLGANDAVSDASLEKIAKWKLGL